jgi:hypothetical protein
MNKIQMQTVINHHELQIEVLKTNAAVVELAVRDICLELEEHGYGDSDNLRVYNELMRGINK